MRTGALPRPTVRVATVPAMRRRRRCPAAPMRPRGGRLRALHVAHHGPTRRPAVLSGVVQSTGDGDLQDWRSQVRAAGSGLWRQERRVGGCVEARRERLLTEVREVAAGGGGGTEAD